MQRLIRKAELLVEGTRIEALAWIRNRLFMEFAVAFAFAWHMTHMPESSRLHHYFKCSTRGARVKVRQVMVSINTLDTYFETQHELSSGCRTNWPPSIDLGISLNRNNG